MPRHQWNNIGYTDEHYNVRTYLYNGNDKDETEKCHQSAHMFKNKTNKNMRKR